MAADLARIDVRGTSDLLTYYLAGDAGTRAFFRRAMYARAVAAIRRAEALHPTDTGALRLESYEQALR